MSAVSGREWVMTNITELKRMIEGFSTSSKNDKKSKNNSFRKTNKKNKAVVNINFNEAGTLARIAGAKTKSQAAAIERSLRMELNSAKRFDADAATIKSIKRTIGKANGKFKAMSKEERLDNNRRIAKSAKNIEQERKLRAELERKRRIRKSKERADVGNAKELYNKKGEKYKEDKFDYLEEVQFDVECYQIAPEAALLAEEGMAANADAAAGAVDGSAGAVIDQIV